MVNKTRTQRSAIKHEVLQKTQHIIQDLNYLTVFGLNSRSNGKQLETYYYYSLFERQRNTELLAAGPLTKCPHPWGLNDKLRIREATQVFQEAGAEPERGSKFRPADVECGHPNCQAERPLPERLQNITIAEVRRRGFKSAASHR